MVRIAVLVEVVEGLADRLLVALLQLVERDVHRQRELLADVAQVAAALGLQDQSLTESDLILAMTKNPILIERPIAIAGNRVVIGRPPENILALIP